MPKAKVKAPAKPLLPWPLPALARADKAVSSKLFLNATGNTRRYDTHTLPPPATHAEAGWTCCSHRIPCTRRPHVAYCMSLRRLQTLTPAMMVLVATERDRHVKSLEGVDWSVELRWGDRPGTFPAVGPLKCGGWGRWAL